jgi:hypothetical protein
LSEDHERHGKVNRNSLRPMYEELTEEERFRLSLRALASGDHSEATHLAESCPRVDGSAVDPAFSDPVHASYRLASVFARIAGPLLGWLNLVEALELILTGEKGRDSLERRCQFVVTMVLDSAAQSGARRLRSLVDAFDQVCSERAGLPGSVLLCAWVQETAIALHQAGGWIVELEADPAIKDEFKITLDQAWTLQVDD